MSREYRCRVQAMQQKNPELWTKLRQDHNAVLRQWSYRGTTSVPRQERRGSSMRVISRYSRDSADLPPLFHQVPDLRDKTVSDGNVSKNLKWMLTALTPATSLNLEHPFEKLSTEGAIDLTRIIEKIDKHRISEPVLPETGPNELNLPQNLDSARHPSLDAITGIAFCEEMLQYSQGEGGIEESFRLMDQDADGSISLDEFVRFFHKLGIGIPRSGLITIHQFLRKSDHFSQDCTPAHFSDRTKRLVRKYQTSGKSFPSILNSEVISPAEKYFLALSYPKSP